MKKRGKELTGRHLHQFLLRFFETQEDVEPETAERFSGILAATFATVRLRRYDPVFNGARLRGDFVKSSFKRLTLKSSGKVVGPKPSNSSKNLENISSSNSDPGCEEKFDPYAFSLIPIFIREGPDGLIQCLNTIHSLDNLREIARLQQLALPLNIRYGDISIDDAKSAILNAVRKRVADRRAAAG
ncbi:MAG: hypothetical protein HRT83_02585 [Hyphomicrobiaceae bacterium]|nr:hypothetical protein [Hyphomicrobiaceae bacterium]